MIANISKGSRLRARWETTRVPCLAGVQMKLEVQVHDVVGTVRHLRGDHPIHPKVIRAYIDPEGECAEPRVRPPGCTCPEGHVEIDPAHVVDEASGAAVVECVPIARR